MCWAKSFGFKHEDGEIPLYGGVFDGLVAGFYVWDEQTVQAIKDRDPIIFRMLDWAIEHLDKCNAFYEISQNGVEYVCNGNADDVKRMLERAQKAEMYPLLSPENEQFVSEYIAALEAELAERTAREKRKAARAARRKGGYVYVVKGVDRPVYKIGMTKRDPHIRIDGLSKSLPWPVETICTFETVEASGKVERILHERFADRRVNGEWFQLEPPDLEYLAGLAKQSPVSCKMI